ncbi:ATP synthase F1 subunit gamma [Oscillospiraceae bacterium CM]|nr:ATP synthase F1 subunit gamma [Oscillospiraceae bacterium CM]
MASPTEIRHHIAAVEQTKKITGAMEMVSSTRMKRVMSHIEQNHRYFDHVQKTMKEILVTAQGVSHPYLKDVPAGGHCTYIIISGDKGLCGSYNSNVLNLALRHIEEHPNHSILTIGNTAEDFFNARSMVPDVTYLGIAQDPALTRARMLVRDVMALYDSGKTDEVRLVYTSFYGATKNRPVERRLLPIRLDDYSDIADAETLADIMYHPTPQELFDLLIPQYILGILFGVMVQAYASEHFARMNAMHSATTNAQDMLKSLRTKYNLARQSAITNEIAEITGAAEILRKGDR